MTIQLLIIGIVVSLDNFRVALGLGALRLTRLRRIQIALAFCFFEALTPLVGLVLGNSLIESMRPWVESIGPIILGGFGLYIIYRSFKPEEEDQPFNSHWVILGLPLSLSLDNLLAGVGLGTLGAPVLLSAIVIGLISGAMCLIGLFISGAVAKYLPSRTDLLSGAILVFLAALMVGH